jgi:hypothetical protein
MVVQMMGCPLAMGFGKVRFEIFDDSLANMIIGAKGLYIKTVAVDTWPSRHHLTTKATSTCWLNVDDIRAKVLTLQNRTVYTLSIYGKFMTEEGNVCVHKTLNLVRDQNIIYRMCGFMGNFEDARVSNLLAMISDERLPFATIAAILEM